MTITSPRAPEDRAAIETAETMATGPGADAPGDPSTSTDKTLPIGSLATGERPAETSVESVEAMGLSEEAPAARPPAQVVDTTLGSAASQLDLASAERPPRTAAFKWVMIAAALLVVGGAGYFAMKGPPDEPETAPATGVDQKPPPDEPSAGSAMAPPDARSAKVEPDAGKPKVAKTKPKVAKTKPKVAKTKPKVATKREKRKARRKAARAKRKAEREAKLKAERAAKKAKREARRKAKAKAAKAKAAKTKAAKTKVTRPLGNTTAGFGK